MYIFCKKNDCLKKQKIIFVLNSNISQFTPYNLPLTIYNLPFTIQKVPPAGVEPATIGF